MRNVSHRSSRENQITQIVFSKAFFFKKKTLYEIKWKSVVQTERPQITIWRMRTSCWVPKATNTHSAYVIFIAFPLQQSLHELTSVLRYMYIACLVSFYELWKSTYRTPLIILIIT